MSSVVLALGANLGDRQATLQAALDRLSSYDGITVTAVSPVYETEPVGPAQPDFLNAVALATTALTPRELIALTQHVERVLGRQPGERWGPRLLDVDIVCYDDVVTDDPLVTLPHPEAANRAFVLVPWSDVDPDATLPGTGAVADRLAVIGRAGVQRRDDLALRVPS